MKKINKLKMIKGDASFRKFYRNSVNKSIFVVSKKEKSKNLLVYDAINKILIKNNILAPKLLNENYLNKYIEIEDFGDQTFFEILKNKKNNKYVNFKKIVKLLNKLQSIKDRKILNFKKKIYRIQEYKKKILFNEARLFCDWYVPKKLSKTRAIKFNKKFKYEIKYLLSKLNCKNDTFVHRDFHVSNLMHYKKTIALIDSQDALIGNKAYDLASLIDDVRFRSSKKTKELVYNQYMKLNKKNINYNNFRNDFEILSVIRNLKIIGIFSRLAIRDKKIKYLRLIPYAWELIDLRIKNNMIFRDLKKYLDFYYPTKIRKKNAN